MSINFTGQATQIPASWANDVDALVYDVFSAAQSLPAVKTLLGLDKLDNGGVFFLQSGSTIDGSAIGATQASTARFSSVKLVGPNPGSATDDVVIHSQLTAAIAALTDNSLGDLAAQAASAVVLTGGTINGVTIGLTTPAAAAFTELSIPDPTAPVHAVNRRYLDARFAALPVFGTVVTQDSNAVVLTGGTINGVTIGQTTPAAAAFTTVGSSVLNGGSARIVMNGSTTASTGRAFQVEGTDANNIDMGFSLQDGGRFNVASGSNVLAFVNGHLLINATDDGATALQVGGSVKAAAFTTSMLVPTAAGHLTSKTYVDQSVASAVSQIAPAVVAALAGLGDLSSQSAASVTVSGGSIDGTPIGANAQASGSFTQVNTATVSGVFGLMSLAGTGGYVGSGLVLGAVSNARPNVSVVPNANGTFAVMAGSQAVFRTHLSGQTVIGLGGNDLNNKLQVYGDAVVHGRMTFDGGTMTGSAAASLSNAPTLASSTPIWVRVRVNTANGVKECVMPAFEVA